MRSNIRSTSISSQPRAVNLWAGRRPRGGAPDRAEGMIGDRTSSNPSQLTGNDRPKSARGNKTRPSTLMLAFRVNSYRERWSRSSPASLIGNDRGMISCLPPQRTSCVSRSPLKTGSLDQRAARVFCCPALPHVLLAKAKPPRSTVAQRLAMMGWIRTRAMLRLPSMLAFGRAPNRTCSLRLMARFWDKFGTAFGDRPSGALANLL